MNNRKKKPTTKDVRGDGNVLQSYIRIPDDNMMITRLKQNQKDIIANCFADKAYDRACILSHDAVNGRVHERTFFDNNITYSYGDDVQQTDTTVFKNIVFNLKEIGYEFDQKTMTYDDVLNAFGKSIMEQAYGVFYADFIDRYSKVAATEVSKDTTGMQTYMLEHDGSIFIIEYRMDDIAIAVDPSCIKYEFSGDKIKMSCLIDIQAVWPERIYLSTIDPKNRIQVTI